MFVDASDSFFDIKKLHECTVKDGKSPSVQVIGERFSEYILTIDPSYSSSTASDYFAMGVYQLCRERRTITQVHSYGRAGADIREHYEYLAYILLHFNIVYLTIDASGTEFIDSFNNSTVAKAANLSLGYINADLEEEGKEYGKQVKEARRQYSKENRKFVYPQLFTANWLRKANYELQAAIAAEKIWFGSRLSFHSSYDEATKFEMPYAFKDHKGKPYQEADGDRTVEFLDDQDNWIEETKSQLARIEVTSTGIGGTMRFDLPKVMKNSKKEGRPRRDNYTCLLMAYYSSRHFFDIMEKPDKPTQMGFVPFFI
jgi:hypothetical protein